MKSKYRNIMYLFLLCLGIFSFFIAFSLVWAKKAKYADTDDTLSEDKIAVVEVEGVILTSKKIIERLHQVENDKKVKGIIVRIDSPGGAVAPTQEVYDEIIRIKKIKPVYSSLGSVAASGGYYIAAATDKIFASAGSLTGSIGVIMNLVDLSNLMKFIKVNPEVIKAGEYKDIGNTFRPMKEKEKELLKDVLANVHQQFMQDITQVRGKRLKKDINLLAQGQIFSGKQAQENGLIDSIGGLWESGRQMHKALNLVGNLNLVFIKDKKKFSLDSIIDELESAMQSGLLNLKNFPMLLYQ